MSADAERLIAYWEAGKTHDSYTTLVLKGDALAAALAAATAENERRDNVALALELIAEGEWQRSPQIWPAETVEEFAKAALAPRVPRTLGESVVADAERFLPPGEAERIRHAHESASRVPQPDPKEKE